MQLKTTNDVGSLIRDHRMKRGWTQEELATRAGVSRLWIAQLEKGKSTAQIGLALRTLKELGVVIDASIPEAVTTTSTRAKTVNLDHIIQRTRPTKS